MSRVRVALYVAVLSCSSYDAASSAPADAGTPADGAIGSEGGLPVDAGTDARGPFCASFLPAPLFCADFDEGKPFNYGFTEKAGDFAIDSTTWTSSPSSLLIPASLDGGNVYLKRTLDPVTTTSWKLGFSIRWGPADAAPPPGGVPVRLNDTKVNDCSFFLIKNNGGAWYLEVDATRPDAARTADAHALPLFPIDGVWTRVEIVLAETQAGVVSASVLVDGQTSLSPTPTDCRGLGAPLLTVGAQYATSGQLNIDDIVLTAQP